jgi:hypothetical protein
MFGATKYLMNIGQKYGVLGADGFHAPALMASIHYNKEY